MQGDDKNNSFDLLGPGTSSNEPSQTQTPVNVNGNNAGNVESRGTPIPFQDITGINIHNENDDSDNNDPQHGGNNNNNNNIVGNALNNNAEIQPPINQIQIPVDNNNDETEPTIQTAPVQVEEKDGSEINDVTNTPQDNNISQNANSDIQGQLNVNSENDGNNNNNNNDNDDNKDNNDPGTPNNDNTGNNNPNNNNNNTNNNAETQPSNQTKSNKNVKPEKEEMDPDEDEIGDAQPQLNYPLPDATREDIQKYLGDDIKIIIYEFDNILASCVYSTNAPPGATSAAAPAAASAGGKLKLRNQLI